MYVGPNKIAQARRQYRTTVSPSLSGIFSKIKKAIRKITPRELEPHRVAKHNAKQKAKIAAAQAEVEAAKSETADVRTQAQIDVLTASALPPTSPVPAASFKIPTPTQSFALPQPANTAPGFSPAASFAPVDSPSATAPEVAPAEDNTMLYAGLGLLGLGALYLFTRGRK